MRDPARITTEAGGKYADTVAAILANLTSPAVVKVVDLSNLSDHSDIVEWIDAHGDVAEPDELRRQVESLADQAEAIRIRAAPRERDRARIEFRPIPASQLGDGEQVDWIWHGHVTRGYVTLLVGLWKAGKSTLLSYFLKAMQDGGDLARNVIAAKVLVITEEGSGLGRRRATRCDVKDSESAPCRNRTYDNMLG